MIKLEDRYVDEMATIMESLAETREEASEKMDDLIDKVADLNATIRKYNNMLKNARDVRGKVVKGMNDFLEQQPDQWVEGDAGKKYVEWRDEWQYIDLADVPMVDEQPFTSLELGHEDEINDLRYTPGDSTSP